MIFTKVQTFLDKLERQYDNDSTLTLDRLERDDVVPDRVDSSREISVQHSPCATLGLEPISPISEAHISYRVSLERTLYN